MKIQLHPQEEEKDFFVKCNVCKHVYKNWIGSTYCCGSIAYQCNEDGSNESDTINLFGFTNNQNQSNEQH